VGEHTIQTELRSLVEHRSVAGARFPHSCRRQSSQLKAASPFQPSRAMRNVHKGAPITVIPLGGRQLADRESEHCQPNANEILPG
jgi:hypothetical protein